METSRPAKKRRRAPFTGLDFSKPLPPFLDSREFAALAHTSLRSVERWRAEGSGPPFCVARGRVLYDTATALAWIRSTERTSTSAPPSPRAA
jgi:hypothetical protein